VTTEGRRLNWVDRARGAAICLVVLHHATLAALGLGLTGDSWRILDGLLEGTRMPLLFFVSGVLAARAMQRSWRDLLRGKVATLVWLYVVWLALSSLVAALLPSARSSEPVADPAGAWSSALHAFDAPDSSLWYLYVLALFTVAGRLLRRVPTVPLLAVAVLVSVVVTSVEALAVDNYTWSSVGRLFPFFLAGTRLLDLVVRRVTPLPLGAGLLVLAASPGVSVVSRLLPDGVPLPGLHLVVGGLGVLGGLVVAARLPDVAPVRALAHLGRRTLPVYVLHELVLVAAAVLGLRALAGAHAPLAVPLPELTPPALAVLGVLLSLLLHRALERVPGLFGLPRVLAAPSGRAAPAEVPARRRG